MKHVLRFVLGPVPAACDEAVQALLGSSEDNAAASIAVSISGNQYSYAH